MVKIPFADLGAQHKETAAGLKSAIAQVILRGDFILGEDVSLLEEEFSKFINSRYAVGVSSGTAALFLALKSLGIKEGDEVIVPDFTYIATAMAVTYTGAKPVFVDIEEDAYNIDVYKISGAVNKRTKAIIPVHLFGQPANMPEILKMAKGYKLKVIEDAAQAHGATVEMPSGRWEMSGSMAEAGCFSFYPSKNLGSMGDAGMVTTNDPQIYKKLLILGDQGRVSKYEHKIIGYNARLDTMQAAILRIKLKRLKSWNAMRQRNAAIYNRLLAGINGVITPYVAPRTRHVYHVYVIRTKRRDEVAAYLRKKGIGAMVHYHLPLHLQEAYRDLGYKRGDFPVSERVAGEVISLPMYPHLKEAQIKTVVKVIKEAIKD